MSDQYIIQNEDRILRPVTLEDAEFIVRLRNQDLAHGYIHDTSLDVEIQRQWLRDFFQRENEYYWIITTLDGTPYGTLSLYNYDKEKNQIESGRWVRFPGYDSNIIAGHVQMNDFIFNYLHIDRKVCDVVNSNKKVLKYHRDILRLKQLDTIEIRRDVGGQDVEVYSFEETRDTWTKNRPRFLHLCGDMSKWSIKKIVL